MTQTRRSGSHAFFIGLSAVAAGVTVLAATGSRSARVDRRAALDALPADRLQPPPDRSEPAPVLLTAAVQPPAADELPTQAAATDAGASATELQLLRDQVAVLQQQLAQMRTDSRTRLLKDVEDGVARVSEQQAWQQAREEERAPAAQQRSAERDDAIDTLLEVYQRLSVGDADVLDALAGASAALPFPAQRAVETARVAIGSEDLFAARYSISVAIAESERTQLRR